MTAKIQTRRDTSANWASNNPILADGEQGFDTTEQKLKIGDGSTAWNSLDYVSGAGGLANDSVERTANFIAELNAEYLLDSSGGTFQVTLPAGEAGARVKLLDSTGFWSSNPPTVISDSGDATAGFNIDASPLELNVPGSWIEFIWNVTSSEWETMGPQSIDETLMIEYETKIYNGTATSAATLLTFNTVVGREYKVNGQIYSSSGFARTDFKQNGILVSRCTAEVSAANGSFSGNFIATGTTATLEWNSGSVNGDGALGRTWATLEEVRSLQTQVKSWEKVVLESNLTGSNIDNGDPILQKTGLVVGRTYTVTGQFYYQFPTNSDARYLYLNFGEVSKSPSFRINADAVDADKQEATFTFSHKFVAEATTLTLEVEATSTTATIIIGSTVADYTYMIVEEERPLESITTATATEAGLLPSYEEETGNLDGNFSGGTYKAVRIGSTVTVTLINPVWSGGGFSAIYSTVLVGNNFRPVGSAYQTSDPRASVAIVGVNATGRLELILRSPTNLNAARAENSAAMSSATRTYSVSYNV